MNTRGFVYQLLVLTVIFASVLSGCKGPRLYMREPEEEILVDPTIPQVSIVTPASGTLINSMTSNPMTVSGTCSESGLNVSVSVSGGATVIATPACSGGFWTTTINFATISDGNVLFTADHASASGVHAATASRTIAKDVVVPTVSTVSTTTASGVYSTGANVNVTVNFSEPVNVTGTPQLTLGTTPNRTLNYVSGTGSSALVFNYTVQAGDISSRLDYPNTTSLSLNGGTIKDGKLNPATLGLPTTASGNDDLYDTNIVIDTAAPLAATSLSWTTASPSSSANVTASWTKSVSGDLASQSIQYFTGAACNTTSGSAIALSAAATSNAFTGTNGNTYTYQITSVDLAGNSTVSACSTAMVIDTAAPTITSVTTTTATGTYGTGATINVTVNFSESVTVSGSPTIALNTTPGRTATCSNGTGTSVSCSYTVQAGDADSRLDYTATTALSGGTIVDGAGNAANLTLPATASSGLYSTNIIVDTAALNVTVNQAGGQADPTNALPISYAVVFSKAINPATFAVGDISNSGTASVTTWALTNSGDDKNFTLRATVLGSAGTVIPSIAAGAVQDLGGGNNNASTFTDSTVTYDTTAPTITSVTTTSGSGTYSTGATINVTLNFSESVVVTGSPVIALNTTPARNAICANGTGTSISCTYTVQAGDADARVDYTSTAALSGGAIADAAGNAATLTLPATASSGLYTTNIKVDTTAPTITSVTTTTLAGSYTTGAVINVTVNFSESVTVTGSPVIALNTTPAHNATCSTGSGTSMSCSYTVQAGDSDTRVDYTATTALSGGTYVDAGANALVTTLPAVGSSGLYTTNIVIDTSTFNLTINQAAGQSDPTNALPITFDVVFNKPINTGTFTTADITNSGTASVTTWTITNSGDDTNFTLKATVMGSNGTVIPGIAAATVKDVAGNDNTAATFTDRTVTYDNTAPTVTAVDTSTVGGSYTTGAVINVTVFFSETVTVSGSPTITLNTTPARSATCSNGTAATMSCSYTVQAGDSDARLDYTATTALTGGTIVDAAGNAATRTFPAVGASDLYLENIIIDTSALSVTVNQAGGQADPANALPVSFAVVFNKAINAATFTTADISNTGTASVTTWTITDSGDHINFSLKATVMGSNGTIIPSIGAGIVSDLAGNTNTASTTTDNSVTYDNVAPTVTSVTTTTGSGTYSTGAVINVTVNFSESVTVSGAPTITLNTTPARSATCTNGSGTSMSCSYTVQAGDTDARVDYTATTALTGGTIVDAAGNAATRTLPATGSSGLYTTNLVIDATGLTVTVNQAAGQSDPVNVLPITFDVVFNKAINAATFTTADITQNGTASVTTWTITDSGDHINFTLKATVSGEGTIIPSIAANTVQDPGANNNSASTSTDNTVNYDTTAPTVTSVTTTTGTGSYSTGSVINVTVNFSESVTVSGSPTITLNTTPARSATCSNGSGTAVSCTYTVQANDADLRLDYTATTALSGGTIADAAANATDRTLPATGSSGLYTNNIKINTLAAPTNIALKTPTTVYGNVSKPTFRVSHAALASGVASVNVYSDATCSTLKGTLTAVTGSTTSDIQLTAALTNATSTTQYYADFIDSVGNKSTCVATGTALYQYDNTAPAAVTAWSLDESGTTYTHTFTIGGSGEGAGTVNIYGDSSCSSLLKTITIAGSGDANPNVAAAFSNNALTVTDGAYTFYYTISDIAGNARACATTGLSITVESPDSTLTSDMPHEHADHTSDLVMDADTKYRVIVVGGKDAVGRATNYVDFYNVDTAMWTPGPNLNFGRTNHASVVMADGRVIVAGGIDENSNLVLATEIWESLSGAADGAWHVTANLNFGRLNPKLALLDDGRVFLTGGYDPSTGLAVKTPEIYDPISNQWTPKADYPLSSYGHTWTHLSDGSDRIYSTGGQEPDGSAHAETFLWSAGTYFPMASLSVPRKDHGAVELTLGSVLIAGNADTSDTSAEVFDNGSGILSTAGNMNYGHACGTAGIARTVDRKLAFVVGSEDASVTHSYADVYSGPNGTWKPSSLKLVRYRTHHTVTTLPDNTVLVIGGTDASGTGYYLDSEILPAVDPGSF